MKRSHLIAGLLIFAALGVFGQLQQSGGGGSAVTLQTGANIAGKFGIDQTTPGTTNGVQVVAAIPAGTNVVGKFGIDQTTPGTTNGVQVVAALPTGTNIIGYTKLRPNGCTAAGTSDVVHDTVGVATGAGTSVSAATGCILECYVNNITNSAVTLRIADKAGTPVIWVGGNGDFSVPANSNLGCGADAGLNISGITFTSGITAIAGTASAINLHLVTRE
jgi:hypothetical protein